MPDRAPKNKAERDVNAVRLLPFFAGGIAGVALFANRVLTPVLTESQARSDVVGTIAAAVLILVGLLWQRIQPVPPDAVELNGKPGLAIDENLPEALQIELAWATHLLLTNTVTKSVAIYLDGKTLLRRGILSDVETVTPGAIVNRVLNLKKPVYLVKLALYPGRIEFNYFPDNTQGIICQPLGDRGVLLLGANVPRSYTRKDEKWIAGIADKLAESFERLVPLADAANTAQT
ncbi:MAG: cofactor assembly of complex C subunit B [Geitlerinemataceae cyanobacterium]